MSYGAGRRDDSESAIAGALLKAGCDVEYAHRKPYDLLVGRAGQTFLLEVKGALRGLTDSQVEFQKSWRGHYAIVRSVGEALKAVGLGGRSE